MHPGRPVSLSLAQRALGLRDEPVTRPVCQHTLAGWRKVFWVAAAINVAGALIYTTFGSGKLQAWAVTEEEGDDAEKVSASQ